MCLESQLSRWLLILQAKVTLSAKDSFERNCGVCCSQDSKDCGVNYQNDLDRGPAGQIRNSDEKTQGVDWSLSFSLFLVHLATISFQEASALRLINTICIVCTKGRVWAGGRVCERRRRFTFPQLIYCLNSASMYLWQVPLWLFILIDWKTLHLGYKIQHPWDLRRWENERDRRNDLN